MYTEVFLSGMQNQREKTTLSNSANLAVNISTQCCTDGALYNALRTDGLGARLERQISGAAKQGEKSHF